MNDKIKWPKLREEIAAVMEKQYVNSGQVKCYQRTKHGRLISYWRRKEHVQVYDKTMKGVV